jgi:hypothetical protein
MFLITPDQKMLKSASDLKLYIAKSGAVIDANIVNFSLPKKTAKVDKALQKRAAAAAVAAGTTTTTAKEQMVSCLIQIVGGKDGGKGTDGEL